MLVVVAVAGACRRWFAGYVALLFLLLVDCRRWFPQMAPNLRYNSIACYTYYCCCLLALLCFLSLFQTVGIFFVTFVFVVVCCCLFGFQVFGPVMRNVGSVAKDGNKIQIRPT